MAWWSIYFAGITVHSLASGWSILCASAADLIPKAASASPEIPCWQLLMACTAARSLYLRGRLAACLEMVGGTLPRRLSVRKALSLAEVFEGTHFLGSLHDDPVSCKRRAPLPLSARKTFYKTSLYEPPGRPMGAARWHFCSRASPPCFPRRASKIPPLRLIGVTRSCIAGSSEPQSILCPGDFLFIHTLHPYSSAFKRRCGRALCPLQGHRTPLPRSAPRNRGYLLLWLSSP